MEAAHVGGDSSHRVFESRQEVEEFNELSNAKKYGTAADFPSSARERLEQLEKKTRIDSNPLLNGGLGMGDDRNGHKEFERIEKTLEEVGLTIDDIGRKDFDRGDSILALSSLAYAQDEANLSAEDFDNVYQTLENYEKTRDNYIASADLSVGYSLMEKTNPVSKEDKEEYSKIINGLREQKQE